MLIQQKFQVSKLVVMVKIDDYSWGVVRVWLGVGPVHDHACTHAHAHLNNRLGTLYMYNTGY